MSLKCTFSAPGKVILFGEHAVVYGHPAISTAISKRMSAKAELYKSIRPEVHISGNNTHVDYDPTKPAESEESNVQKMARYAFNGLIPDGHSLNITISSEFPTGNGMGSSASFVSLLSAIGNRIKGVPMDLDKLLEKSTILEGFFHAKSSGIDPATVIFGGGVFMEKGVKTAIKINPIPLIVVDTGVQRSTAVAVQHVASLNRLYPKVYGPILSTMGELTRTFVSMDDQTRKSDTGKLFNVANNMLEACGLGCNASDRIATLAKQNNINVKISGAGMGGIMLSTGEDPSVFQPFNAFSTRIGEEGIREE